MEQEQKATAYDEAIERAKEQLDGAKVFDYKDEQIAHDIRTTIYEIFPELKETTDNEKIRKEILDYIDKSTGCKRWVAWLEKQGEQKPTEWSEEDERIINSIIHDIRTSQHYDTHSIGEYDKKVFWLKSLKPYPRQEWSEDDEMITLSIEQVMNCASLLNIVPEKIDKIRAWLLSLKDRVQPQPKQEWSEEDEKRLKSCLNVLQAKGIMGVTDTINTKWLKSLKERVGNFDGGYKVGFSAAKHNQWKPSDEQMERLKGTINSLPHQEVLYSLYEDLKKLKEGQL